MNKTVPSTSSTYKIDLASEGHKEDTTIHLKGKLNNQAIKIWWEKNNTIGYSVKNNCSNMVEKALEAGELESNELKSIQDTLAEWRKKVAKIVTENHKGSGAKYQKAVKRLDQGHDEL